MRRKERVITPEERKRIEEIGPPRLIEKDGKYFVTDGYIGTSFFKIAKQPSQRAIDALYDLYIKTAEMSKTN